MEGSLSREARGTAERHAAGCARCQAMLAAMARTAPEPAARPWWRIVTLKWMVPVAAAATALVVWVAVDRDRAAPIESVATETAAPMPAAPPSRPGAARDDMPIGQRGSSPRVPDSAAAGGRTALDDTSPLTRPQAAAADSRLEPRRRTDVPEMLPRLVPTDKSAAASPPPPPPPPAARTPSSAAAIPAPPVGEPIAPVAGVAEKVVVAAPETSVQSLAGAAGAPLRGVSTDIVSPEPAFRWRLVAPATIQRSTDGGVTWTVQSGRAQGLGLLTSYETSLPVVFTAGSSPARDICWIVGRGGVVLLSSNGTSWQRRPFPEAANLIAVRAVDAKSAVVSTEDGRQFSTIDGGATWLKIP
jgi:hypothetical protein